MDSLTVVQAVAVEISARTQTDSLVIKDVENVISGTSSPEVNLVITEQSDDITIIRPVADNLTIRE